VSLPLFHRNIMTPGIIPAIQHEIRATEKINL
jgi:hypothetical protein